MEEGDTEVDEEIEHLVEVNLKQRASIGKGKKRDMNQRSDREHHLQIIVGLPADQFFQRPLFNLATTTSPSRTLILTRLMTSTLMAISRMSTIGLVTTR